MALTGVMDGETERGREMREGGGGGDGFNSMQWAKKKKKRRVSHEQKVVFFLDAINAGTVFLKVVLNHRSFEEKVEQVT